MAYMAYAHGLMLGGSSYINNGPFLDRLVFSSMYERYSDTQKKGNIHNIHRHGGGDFPYLLYVC